MSTTVNLIFFNCCGREIFENRMVDGMIDGFDVSFSQRISHEKMGEFIAEANKILELRNMGEIGSIHFVDEHYLVNHYYTPEGREHFNSIRQCVTNYSQLVTFHDCKPKKFLDKLQVDGSEVYMFASFDNFSNEYHFFEYLNLNMDDNFFIKWNIRDFNDIFDSKCYMDPFSSNEELKDIYDNDRHYNAENFWGLMREASAQCEFLKKAGLLKRERFIQKSIPAWCLNIESAIFSSGVIRRYQLYPEVKYTEDRTIGYRETVMEHFRESADYRFQILDTMLQVLAKYYMNTTKKEISDYRLFDTRLLFQKIEK